MQYGQELLQFLTELSQNNHKEWFEAHRTRYQGLRDKFTETMTSLHQNLLQFDNDMAKVNPKGSLFRINRDIRFSKDKTPYKIHFSSYFAEGGTQSELAGYYVHIQPNNSFVGGGIYAPMSNEVKKIRQEIDYNTDEFLAIVNHKDFQQYFGVLQGESLKNIPKEYDKTHPLGNYLKLKGFFVMTNLAEKLVYSEEFIPQISEIFKAMYPLNSFLNRAVKG
jgi:uncharacterized protein (TIGR02453 family)